MDDATLRGGNSGGGCSSGGSNKHQWRLVVGVAVVVLPRDLHHMDTPHVYIVLVALEGTLCWQQRLTFFKIVKSVCIDWGQT